MHSQNNEGNKIPIIVPHTLQTNKENPIYIPPLSPQRTCTQKLPNQVTTKTSQQLLQQIYSIIESQQPQRGISRKNSQKSSDRKDVNGNFKCKCKKTRCLKMYCQCFAMGKLCNGCLCCDCQNVLEFQQIRADALDEALERDPNIFQTDTIVKKGGCICKKTGCLKKYCECYSLGMACTPQCKCQNCSNTQ